jgi:hypothetical protein
MAEDEDEDEVVAPPEPIPSEEEEVVPAGEEPLKAPPPPPEDRVGLRALNDYMGECPVCGRQYYLKMVEGCLIKHKGKV